MEKEAMQEELFHLIAYMITSAKGLYNEPDDYGPFRLLDSTGRLLSIMESQGMLDPFLIKLKQSVDEEREGEVDPDRQIERLDTLVMQIAEEYGNRLD